MTAGATAIPEVQALLRTLAAGRDVAEMGAAYGETAAVLAETAMQRVERNLRLHARKHLGHITIDVDRRHHEALIFERLGAGGA